METDLKRTYEGMFLLDSGQDFEAASQPVRAVLERYGAEMLSIKPWDDRKLAYTIAGRKRGLYVLTYFSLDPSQLDEIEHDCRLDERILRVLFLRKDDISDEVIQAETPATASAKRSEQAEQQKEQAEQQEQTDDEKKPAEASSDEGESQTGEDAKKQDESSSEDEPGSEAEAKAEASVPAESENDGQADEQASDETQQDK